MTKFTRIFFTFVLTLAASSPALALEMQIKRLNGKKAIVVFSERPDVREGDRMTVGVSGSSGGSSSVGALDLSQFRYAVTGSFQMNSLTYSSAGSDIDNTTINASLRFGWVSPKFEVGPMFETSSMTIGFSGSEIEVSNFFIGGYVEYNFQTSMDALILSAGGSLGLAGSETGADASGYRIEPYGRAKYFLGPNVALLGQLGYRLEELSADGGVELSASGFVVNAGLGYYF